MVHQVTTSDNERYNKWQQVVQRVTTNKNEWQWMTTSGTTNGSEWQRVVQPAKANESDIRFQSETIMQCKTTIYSATSFWKYNVKQNIYRSSHRRCPIKELLLAVLQYSQENTWRRASLLKRDSNTSIFLWTLQNF